jgi:hypothetical protein
MEDRREHTTNNPGLAGPLGEIDPIERKRYARRLMLRAMPLVPFIVASVLTTKSVAATKVIAGLSIPISL